ncbi:hypothetical protein QE152_g6218 [Popillia japonica]|uniref:Uncharacterized protein n=1 Tax=Popillia japonica TaxID=7064 RepID=A0AAW1MJD4_POPJA
MDLPKPRIIVPNLPKLPYVLVGDEGRENNLPGHLQTYCPLTFIDREDEHGSIVQGEWRRQVNPPLTFIDREDEHGSIVQGEWRRQVNPLPSICNAGTNSNSRSAAVIRNAFKHYMVNEGAVPWQWNRDSF